MHARNFTATTSIFSAGKKIALLAACATVPLAWKALDFAIFIAYVAGTLMGTYLLLKKAMTAFQRNTQNEN